MGQKKMCRRPQTALDGTGALRKIQNKKHVCMYDTDHFSCKKISVYTSEMLQLPLTISQPCSPLLLFPDCFVWIMFNSQIKKCTAISTTFTTILQCGEVKHWLNRWFTQIWNSTDLPLSSMLMEALVIPSNPHNHWESQRNRVTSSGGLLWSSPPMFPWLLVWCHQVWWWDMTPLNFLVIYLFMAIYFNLVLSIFECRHLFTEKIQISKKKNQTKPCRLGGWSKETCGCDLEADLRMTGFTWW